MKTKSIIFLVLAFAFGGLIGSMFGQSVTAPVGTSDAGSTFSSPKMSAIVFNPSSTSATTTSVYNSDANDRFITSSFAYCSGVTATPVVALTAATTSTANPTSLGNTNYVLNVTVSTSTLPISATATSTYGSALWQKWPAASYVSFAASATTSATCTIGVNYVPS